MKNTTRVNHPPVVELPADNHSVVAPIYQSVKFEFDSLDETEKFLRGERSGFFYTRASNPTTRPLELWLGATYNPTRYLIRRLLARFGVTHTMLSIEDIAGVEKALAAHKTRLVIFE